MIYREALNIQFSRYREFNVAFNLRQPALLRVNSMIRDEALPIFYGEQEFQLEVPQVSHRLNPIDNWPEFVDMMKSFEQSDSLSHIVQLELRYIEPVQDNMPRYVFHFEAHGSHHGRLYLNPRGMVHRDNVDEHLDWGDKTAVKIMVEEAVKSIDCPGFTNLEKVIPIQRMVDALCMVVKKCPVVSQNVEVFWDWGNTPYLDSDDEENWHP